MYKTAFGLGSQSVFSAFCLVLRGGAGDRGGQGQPGVEEPGETLPLQACLGCLGGRQLGGAEKCLVTDKCKAPAICSQLYCVGDPAPSSPGTSVLQLVVPVRTYGSDSILTSLGENTLSCYQ